MTAEQKPSVGRIVHYQSYGSTEGEFPSTARAALITRVNEDDCDVAVFNPIGSFFVKAKYSTEKLPGTWSWPPRS